MSLLPLVAGPLSMSLDPDTAFLRHLRLGRVEVLRGVFAAIRDQDWNTIPYSIHDLQVANGEDCFEVSFLARCAQREVQFEWQGEIAGTAEGVVRFAFRGVATSIFKRNRIGLCVLHPIEPCAGQPCSVTHCDGSVTQGRFPDVISPHQPFKNIRSIKHPVEGRVHATVGFEGDVFEMEDQRNWTDASFKTYSTPLDLPFPVQVTRGEQIDQTVTISLEGQDVPTLKPARPTSFSGERAARVEIDWAQGHPLPAIGLGMSSSSSELMPAARDLLRELRVRHVRVDLWLDASAWQARARAALELAESIDTQLEVALFAESPSQPSWQECLAFFDAHRSRIARWLVFHPAAKATPNELAISAERSLREFSTTGKIVVGTNAYFAELNRNRPSLGEQACICFSVNPQVHASDRLSIRETLAGQRAAVESAIAIFQRPVVVSPVTLLPRFNPNATSTASSPVDEPATDDRQNTPFTAAWTTGVMQQLAGHPGVSSLTFFETHGPRGIMSAAGDAYPVLDVVREVLSGQSICATSVSQPLNIAALASLHHDGSRRLLLGNMDDQAHAVAVQSPTGHDLRLTLAAESLRVVTNEELR